jgi:chromosome segregation ATPase
MTEARKAEAHQVYKEVVGELNSLANDLVAAISIFRAANAEVKDDISLLRDDGRASDKRHGELVEKVSKLQADIAVVKSQIEAEDQRRRGEMAVKTEDTKGRWAFWVAVVGGIAGTVTAAANLIAAWLH